MQSVNVFLATIILVSFIVTILLGAGSYLAYKLREWKRPRSGQSVSGAAPVYFERYLAPPANEVRNEE